MMFQVPIVSDSVCESAMSSSGVTITSDMLCAGLLLHHHIHKIIPNMHVKHRRGEWQGCLWGEFLLGLISSVTGIGHLR